ncbi:MAG: hypothetical protein SGILL_002244, partial [Bacillariaceae sp.]
MTAGAPSVVARASHVDDNIRIVGSDPLIDPALPAFDQCCRDLECTVEDQAWFPRMRAKTSVIKRGDATLYWAHMRKAGGTTFQAYIESVNEHIRTQKPLPPTSLFTQGFQRTIRPHLQANSRHCVNEHEHSNQTLFVTILRDPFDRYVSEFNYLKLGKGLQAPTMEGKVAEWVNRSVDFTQENGFVNMQEARYHLVENWQVRWYTNDCQCDDLETPPTKKDRGNRNQVNYRYWNAGCPEDFRLSLTEEDVAAAKQQIDQYDITGVAPYFEEGCNMLPWLILAGSNPPAVNLTNEKKNVGRIRKGENYLNKDVARSNLDPKLFELDNEL